MSHIGTFSYFSSYLPLLKKISSPLQTLATADSFYWGKLEEELYKSVKQLIALEVKNYLIDPTKILWITTDFSQISVAYMCFPLSDECYLKVVNCDSRLLKAADRNKCASMIELALVQLENIIREHPENASFLPIVFDYRCSKRDYITVICLKFRYILTLLIMLQSNSPRKSLFYSDLLTRSYNKVVIRNKSTLSREFSQILPPINKKFIQKLFGPEELTNSWHHLSALTCLRLIIVLC